MRYRLITVILLTLLVLAVAVGAVWAWRFDDGVKGCNHICNQCGHRACGCPACESKDLSGGVEGGGAKVGVGIGHKTSPCVSSSDCGDCYASCGCGKDSICNESYTTSISVDCGCGGHTCNKQPGSWGPITWTGAKEFCFRCSHARNSSFKECGGKARYCNCRYGGSGRHMRNCNCGNLCSRGDDANPCKQKTTGDGYCSCAGPPWSPRDPGF